MEYAIQIFAILAVGWGGCGVANVILGILTSQLWKYRNRNVEIENDIHDGSNVIIGSIIGLILGPVGLVLWILSRFRK